MKKLELIKHEGKIIVYLDFSNMRDKAEIIQLENDGADYIRSQAPKSVLTLTNMNGMFFNNDIKKFFEEVVKGNAPYVKVGAVIGMNGLISIMYNTFIKMTGRNIRSFKSKEEALEFLVNQ